MYFCVFLHSLTILAIFFLIWFCSLHCKQRVSYTELSSYVKAKSHTRTTSQSSPQCPHSSFPPQGRIATLPTSKCWYECSKSGFGQWSENNARTVTQSVCGSMARTCPFYFHKFHIENYCTRIQHNESFVCLVELKLIDVWKSPSVTVTPSVSCYYDVFSLVYTRRPALVVLLYGVLYLILTCDIVITYSRMFWTLD